MTPIEIIASSSCTAFFLNCFSFLKGIYDKNHELKIREYPNIIEVFNIDNCEKYKIKQKYPYILSEQINSRYINFFFPSSIYSSYEYLLHILVGNIKNRIASRFKTTDFTILLEIPESKYKFDNIMIVRIDILSINKEYINYAANILREYYDKGLTRFHNSGTIHSYKSFLMAHSEYNRKYHNIDNSKKKKKNRFLNELRANASSNRKLTKNL